MSAFSFTAPLITEEEELSERQALSEEERQRIRQDIGLEAPDPVSISPPSDRVVEQIRQVKEKLLELPQADAYRQALERAPAVVQGETDVAAFLRVEAWDVTRATLRVARFWSLRTEVFGPVVAPLTLQDALASESALLSLGLAFLLPHTDRHGRTVMYFDRTRFTVRVGTREAFLRVLFYTLYSISLRDTPRTGEFVLVLNVKGFDLYKHFDRIMLKKFLREIDALPIELKGLHMCGGPGSSVMTIVMPVFKFMFGAHLRSRTQIQAGSDYEITERLKEYGLDEIHSLPLVRGAIYNQEQCDEFLKEQRKRERARKGRT